MPGFEPSGDARTAAAALWNFFAALVATGFTQEQAVFFIGQMLHGQAIGNAAAGTPGAEP